MKIFITTPALNPPHGGIRVIIEWANRLSRFHDVILYTQKPGRCIWKRIAAKVLVVTDTEQMGSCDCLIISSPHAIHLQNDPRRPAKVFIFMQMLEHLFRPADRSWYNQCFEFYTSPHPLIAISWWNIDRLKTEFGRTGETHYVGNGVNLEEFPIAVNEKDGKTVLVEGWEGYNPTKDVDMIAPKVAKRLKNEGYTVYAYGQGALQTMPEAVTQYFQLPDLPTMNWLYQQATILIKASRFDARSCSPMEAMTKGTVTARAIEMGDDDLIDRFNCIRCRYDEHLLYANCIELLSGETDIREQLAINCRNYVTSYSWDYWIHLINRILTT